MKIIEPGYEILDFLDGSHILGKLEDCGRVCYKSEDKIEAGTAEPFIRGIINRGHESVLEHVSFSVKFIVDRGITHELVRHRIAAFSQESTRYCNYSSNKFGKDVTFIRPFYLEPDSDLYNVWLESMLHSENTYFKMLELGATAQEARALLPNSTKAEIVMTCNLREWRHFFNLRTSKAAHPQMRQVTIPLLQDLNKLVPVIFEDIVQKLVA